MRLLHNKYRRGPSGICIDGEHKVVDLNAFALKSSAEGVAFAPIRSKAMDKH